jgi:putative N6-adenine-specific DNA methylase
VQIKLGEFTASTFDELFEGTKALPWNMLLPKDACFPVTGHSLKSKLHSVPDCQSIIKKAIVDNLSGKYRITQFPEGGSLYKVQFNILKDCVALYVDTSGEGLHKRGYRQDSNIAPIRETLAAAIVSLSRWRPGQAFWDPYCGSGTIVIEAAMAGMNMAPGYRRRFIAETWGNIDKKLWDRAREEAGALVKSLDAGQGQSQSQIQIQSQSQGIEIIGSDIERRSVNASRQNAKNAGVSAAVRFFQMDAAQIQPDHERFSELGVILPDRGCIAGHPPYGDRMSDKSETEYLHKKLGERFKLFDNWRLFIITSDEDFEKHMNKKADKKRKLYNGMIKCDLYQYFR